MAQTTTMALTSTMPGRKIRTACDICHKAKMKCSRGNPCDTCARTGQRCQYSPSSRLGRPPRAPDAKKKAGSVIERRKNSQASTSSTSSSVMADAEPSTGPGSHVGDLLTLDDMFGFPGPSTPSSGPVQMGPTIQNPSHDVYRQNNQLQWLVTTDHPSEAPLEPGSTLMVHDSPNSADRMEDPFLYNSQLKPSRCGCLQQHTQFLCNLEGLDPENHPDTLGLTMEFLQMWQTHLQCQLCWDGENTALWVSIMGLAVLIKRLWRFTADFPSLSGSVAVSTNNYSRLTTPVSATEKTWAESLNNMTTDLDRRDSVSSLASLKTKGDFGEHHILEEEQRVVSLMLVMRFVRRIRRVLTELEDRMGREQQQQGGVNDPDPSRVPLGKLVPVPQMLGNLDGSIEKLEESLKGLLFTVVNEPTWA